MLLEILGDNAMICLFKRQGLLESSLSLLASRCRERAERATCVCLMKARTSIFTTHGLNMFERLCASDMVTCRKSASGIAHAILKRLYDQLPDSVSIYAKAKGKCLSLSNDKKSSVRKAFCLSLHSYFETGDALFAKDLLNVTVTLCGDKSPSVVNSFLENCEGIFSSCQGLYPKEFSVYAGKFKAQMLLLLNSPDWRIRCCAVEQLPVVFKYFSKIMDCFDFIKVGIQKLEDPESIIQSKASLSLGLVVEIIPRMDDLNKMMDLIEEVKDRDLIHISLMTGLVPAIVRRMEDIGNVTVETKKFSRNLLDDVFSKSDEEVLLTGLRYADQYFRLLGPENITHPDLLGVVFKRCREMSCWRNRQATLFYAWKIGQKLCELIKQAQSNTCLQALNTVCKFLSGAMLDQVAIVRKTGGWCVNALSIQLEHSNPNLTILPLVSFLHNESHKVRLAALEACLHYMHPRGIPADIQLSANLVENEENKFVRELGDLEKELALWLSNLTEDQLKSNEHMTTGFVLPKIVSLKKDPVYIVRDAAFRCLEITS